MTRPIILLAAVGYSLLRYGWAKGVPFENWPAYLSNKALASAALLYFAVALVRRDASLARTALVCALAHAFISVTLLGPAYFDYLHSSGGRLNAFGEFAVLGGGLALALMWGRPFVADGGRFARLAVPLVLLAHVAAVGVPKWADPSNWPYGLAPISLLSFLALSVAMLALPVRAIR